MLCGKDFLNGAIANNKAPKIRGFVVSDWLKAQIAFAGISDICFRSQQRLLMAALYNHRYHLGHYPPTGKAR
jgi:hypothetical protein